MADQWEYTSAEAGSFKLDRLLAQGWEIVTVLDAPSAEPSTDPWSAPSQPATIQLRRPTGSAK